MQDYIEQASQDQEEPYYAGDNRFGTQYEDEDQGAYPPEYYYEQEGYEQQQYEYDYEYEQMLEQERRDREYAQYLRNFMTDFEPSD